MKISSIGLAKGALLVFIASILAYAFCITNEALQDAAKWEAKFAEQKAVKLPKYSMDYKTVQMENGITRNEEGHIVAYDSTVLISSFKLFTGKWIQEDIFVSGSTTIFFDEEKVTMLQHVIEASGRKELVDIYIRSDD